VPVLTTAATPKEPRFVERRGAATDLVVVAPDTAFDVYLNGELAAKGPNEVADGSEVTVTAVPKAGFAVDTGAESSWTHQFQTKD
jgi:hypothetical protein